MTNMAIRQLGQVNGDVDDADPLEEQHHQRQLKTDAEGQRHQQHEAEPLADTRIGIDAEPFVECEEEIEHRVEHEEKRQGGPDRKSSRLIGRKTYT